MAKAMKKVISVLLALVLVVGTFAGCGKSNKEETAAITATAVKYTKSGQYTTTVSSKKVDLSGINADNVEVRYLDLTADSAAAKAESTEVATEEATTEAAEEPKLEDVYTLFAKVESVKATDKKSCEITFTDDRAAELITGSYIILFKGVEGDDNTASVEVEFPEITLTPDVENVVSDATQAKVTLAIDGSTFEDGISEKDIYLDNAFSDMKIESVSSSDKNLTVQLKGSPVRNEVGTYQWGAIKVKPSGIKDGYADVTSKIDIQLATVNIDTATLKFENGKIKADLKVYGIVDINTLTKDNIIIDGTAVEAAEKADDNTVKLTLTADGVKSANDFADLIGGKAMKIGDYETTVSVLQASFYPVFDYVEADGDNLKLTLKLYANSGTFDKNIKADAISFADDFKDAKAESVTVDSDTVATLIFSVPANGQTTETMSLNGTVTLAAGALTNAWGDKTSNDTSYTRDYSGESLGREVTLNAETLLEIQKYTRGLETTFGKICYYGQIAGQVFSIAKSILEAVGVVESEHAQVMKELKAINHKLDTIIENQQAIQKQIEELGIKLLNDNSAYEAALGRLKTNLDIQYGTYEIGALLMAIDDAVAEGKISSDEVPTLDYLTDAQLEAALEEYRVYLPNVDDMTDKEAAEYNSRLVDYIKKRSQDFVPFSSFDSTYENIKDALTDVTNLLNAEKVSANPMQKYDEICALTFNFDSQSYNYRLSKRLVAQTEMSRAMAIIYSRQKAFQYTYDPTYKVYAQNVEKAVNQLESINASVDSNNYLRVNGVAPEEVKANPQPGTDKDKDTAYYPYSYVLGAKIACYNFDADKLFASLEGKPIWLSSYESMLKETHLRNWTPEEATAFAKRMQFGTIEEELKSVGFETGDYYFATGFNIHYEYSDIKNPGLGIDVTQFKYCWVNVFRPGLGNLYLPKQSTEKQNGHIAAYIHGDRDTEFRYAYNEPLCYFGAY